MNELTQMKELNRFFLIGNGFDINHGLQTSYKHFLTDYVTKSVKKASVATNNIYEDDSFQIEVWNQSRLDNHAKLFLHLEMCLKKENISDFIRDKDYVWPKRPENTHPPLIIRPKNNFIKEILRNCFDCDWNGIEDEIYKTIMTFHFKIQEYQKSHSITPIAKVAPVYSNILAEIKNLNMSIDCLKVHLKEYLLTQNKPVEHNIDLFRKVATTLRYEAPVDADLESPKNLSTNLFLNFNYTTYVKDIVNQIDALYGNDETVFQTLNIHGDLDSDIDDIVFGIGDEQNDFYQEIESRYDDDWLECMKSFRYFRNENYQDLLGFIKRGEYEIYVMGHSCSITDRTLLNMLFENEYCKKIHVFHYKGMTSYLRTTYNIARNFTDKVKMREVLMPFNADLTM